MGWQILKRKDIKTQLRTCGHLKIPTARLRSKAPWRTAKYCSAAKRLFTQSALNPTSIMLGESLPNPARFRQDFAPSSKLLLSVTEYKGFSIHTNVGFDKETNKHTNTNTIFFSSHKHTNKERNRQTCVEPFNLSVSEPSLCALLQG